jgi:hypothetical protein
MKNKLITNDSYIRKLIKESIIFNTKKQNLMNWFEPTLKRFKDKLYETEDSTENLRILRLLGHFIQDFHDNVRKMASQSDMFEHKNKRTLMEGSRFVEENFPDYKKFMDRFINCENSQQCLFLTNRFVDEFQYFISNVKKQIDNPETKKGSTRIELKLRDIPKLLDSMSNRSNFKDIVLSIMASIAGPGFLGKSPASNIYTVLMYIIQKYDNLLGSSIDIKKISNGKFLLRINHPKANQIILDANKQEANKA